MSTNPDFEAFFAEHHDPVVRALTLALADRSRAEDAAQEAFARAFRSWRRVSMMERPVAWVYVVALNGGRKARRRELAAPAPDLLGPAADPATAVTARVSVHEALTELAPRQRTAVVLRYLADLKVDEVAEAMGVTVGTAKATLHTALARLRVDLGAEPATRQVGAAAVPTATEAHVVPPVLPAGGPLASLTPAPGLVPPLSYRAGIAGER